MEGILYKKGSNLLNPYQPRYFITENYYLKYDSSKDKDHKDYVSVNVSTSTKNAISPRGIVSPRDRTTSNTSNTSSTSNNTIEDKSIDLRKILSINPGIIGDNNISNIDFHIITRDRNYQFRCNNNEECNIWLDCLNVYNGGAKTNPSIPNRLSIAILACINWLEINGCDFLKERDSNYLRPLYRNILMNHEVALSQTNDKNLVFSCLKLLLLRLPTTILTSLFFLDFIKNAGDPKEIRCLYQKLPDINRKILFKICKLFIDNKVAATDLISHLGAALTDPTFRYFHDEDDHKNELSKKGSLSKLCVTLLTSFKFIFDEFEEAATSLIYSPRRAILDDDSSIFTRSATRSNAGSNVSFNYTNVSAIDTMGRKVSSAESFTPTDQSSNYKESDCISVSSPSVGGRERKIITTSPTKISAPPAPNLKLNIDSINSTEFNDIERAKLLAKVSLQNDMLQKAKEREKDLVAKLAMLSSDSVTTSSMLSYSPLPPGVNYADKDTIEQLKFENELLKSKLEQSDIEASKMKAQIFDLNSKFMALHDSIAVMQNK